MKIDFHVHVTPPEIIANRQKYAKKEKYFSLLSKNPHNKYACAEDIIAAIEPQPRLTTDKRSGEGSPLEPQPRLTTDKWSGEGSPLDESGFDHAVVFGFAFLDQGLCRFVNDYVIEKVKQYPGKLTGFISVSPNAKGAEKEIERCYAAGLRGIGELYPDGQGFNIDNEKETRAFTGACIERNIPLILHVNEPVGHDYIGKNDIPLKKIEKFVNNSPNLKIILAHFGGGILFYETMKEIKEKFSNVYYDTAAAPFLYDSRIYSAIKALGLCEKILFGSDFPLLPPSRYLPAIEKSGLSPEEKQLILGANAEKLLKC